MLSRSISFQSSARITERSNRWLLAASLVEACVSILSEDYGAFEPAEVAYTAINMDVSILSEDYGAFELVPRVLN